jgi:hypothetical protein
LPVFIIHRITAKELPALIREYAEAQTSFYGYQKSHTINIGIDLLGSHLLGKKMLDKFI